MDSFGSVDKLEGSDLREKGGLVYPKGPSSSGDSSHVFKKPQSSIRWTLNIQLLSTNNGMSVYLVLKMRISCFNDY